MAPRHISDTMSVSGQILPADAAALKADGYSTIICNRPDNEEPGQPAFAEIAAAAEAAGMEAHHIPIRPGQGTAADVAAFGKAVAGASGKVLAYCKSGGRAQSLYEESRR